MTTAFSMPAAANSLMKCPHHQITAGGDTAGAHADIDNYFTGHCLSFILTEICDDL